MSTSKFRIRHRDAIGLSILRRAGTGWKVVPNTGTFGRRNLVTSWLNKNVGEVEAAVIMAEFERSLTVITLEDM